MKLKNGFVLKEIAGECVVVATDDALDLNGMINLNSTGKTLWLALEKDTDIDGLVKALTSEYDVDDETARRAAEYFVAKLAELGFLA